MSEVLYRPGLEGIIAGETSICSLERGLEYRGYAIEELADQTTFEEVAYLVLQGELPTLAQLRGFQQQVSEAMLPPPMFDLLALLPPATPPMDMLRTAVSALGHWDADVVKMDDAANLRKAIRLLGQIPQLIAAYQRLRSGLEPLGPRPGLGLSAQFLWLLRGELPSDQAVRALDVTAIMYAEHEFNASTFSARVTCSTLADLHSAITSAIGTLKGPLHGGANEKVMDLLQAVGNPANAEAWIKSALARKEKIMGFGHRVYKTGDPRAHYLKTLCQELAAETGREEVERTAEVIEQYVVREKRIPPNLDWPTARIYHYLGLATDLFTPLFVASRVSGWSAHVIEQLQNNRIMRPLARYIGPGLRHVIPLADRVEPAPAG